MNMVRFCIFFCFELGSLYKRSGKVHGILHRECPEICKIRNRPSQSLGDAPNSIYQVTMQELVMPYKCEGLCFIRFKGKCGCYMYLLLWDPVGLY